jgi:hypothetical protein
VGARRGVDGFHAHADDAEHFRVRPDAVLDVYRLLPDPIHSGRVRSRLPKPVPADELACLCTRTCSFDVYRLGSTCACRKCSVCGFTDLTLNLTDELGYKVDGTFFPFPHDKPPVHISQPNVCDGSGSKLDYAFGNNVQSIKSLILTDLKNERGIPISDHFPLLVRIAF